MPENYPLGISAKVDSALRLLQLEGIDPKFFTTAAEFNKLILAIEELFTIRPQVKLTIATIDYVFDLYKNTANADIVKRFTLQRLDVIIGFGPNGEFFQAKFIGLPGEETDLQNEDAYIIFGGI